MSEINSNTSQELTIDIVIGGLGKGGESLSSIAQKGLLDAFKAASKLEDLAAKLVIPIQLIQVTGMKVVSAYGYDAYKITVAIRSDDANAVAKEIFSSGVGLATTGVLGVALRPLMVTGPWGVAASIGGPIVLGSIASKYAEYVWTDTIAQGSFGQWTTGQITDSFGIGLKVTPGPLSVPNTSIPAPTQAPFSTLAIDSTDGSARIVINNSTGRTFDPDVSPNGNTYTVSKGDSLWKIAMSNGWNFEALKAANQIGRAHV